MPPFSRAVEHRHPVVRGGELVGQLTGAVGRAVVDDQHAEAVGGGPGEHLAGGAATIGLMFSASLYVGSISHGSSGHRPAYPRQFRAAATHLAGGAGRA